MTNCTLNFEDFKRVFDFSIKYHLSNKSLTDRTNGNPRSLGAIMDAFSRGKPTEIGVEKMLYTTNSNKNYILDFDIHEANNDPDIIKITENGEQRDVNCFIEIKNLSNGDNWIGLREEQFTAIKVSASAKNIDLDKVYIIYATLKTEQENKENDLTGMFLKKIEDINKTQLFQKYAELNAQINIEIIISLKDLDKFKRIFLKGEYFYGTNLFYDVSRKSIYDTENLLRSKFTEVKNYQNYSGDIELNISPNNEKTKDLREFQILNSANFKIIKKTNEKSEKYFIECFSDVKLFNEVFGHFDLNSNNIYTFDIDTIGRNPALKNNNLFISKRRVYELINDHKILSVEQQLQNIANSI